MLWRYGPDELDQVLPTLSWGSYVELAGAIDLSPGVVDERRAELARYVVTGTGRDALQTRREGYRRD